MTSVIIPAPFFCARHMRDLGLWPSTPNQHKNGRDIPSALRLPLGDKMVEVCLQTVEFGSLIIGYAARPSPSGSRTSAQSFITRTNRQVNDQLVFLERF